MMLPLLLIAAGVALFLVSLRGMPPLPRPKLSDLAPAGIALGIGLAIFGLTVLVLKGVFG